MLDISKEALTELGMRLHFYAAEATNGFFFARATWAMPRAPEYIPHCTDNDGIGVEKFPILGYRAIAATIFYRKAFHWKSYHREAAYYLALYKNVPDERFIFLGHTLDEVLALLPEHGSTGNEQWLSRDYDTLHHHIAPAHQETVWNSHEFGVVLHHSTLHEEIPALDDLDKQPF